MSKRLQGLNAWILQRGSAVYLAGFIIYFIGVLLFDAPDSFTAWQEWIKSPIVSIAWMMFFALLLGHAWVGMRDVFMDYISSIAIRSIALGLLALALLAGGLWMTRIMVLAFIK